MTLLKRFFCRNHEYETITNLHGDAINHHPMIKGKYIARSVKRCKHCGRLKLSPYLDPKCNIVNYTQRFCNGCKKEEMEMEKLNDGLFIITKDIVKEVLESKEDLILEAYRGDVVAVTNYPIKVKVVKNDNENSECGDASLVISTTYNLLTNGTVFAGVEYIDNIRIFRTINGEKQCIIKRLFDKEMVKPTKAIGFDIPIHLA